MKTPFLLMAAAGALAAPGLAQQPAKESDQSAIVVEGRRGDEGRQIQEFLKSLPRVSANGHIARFEDAACPVVIGLAADRKAMVEARMRRVAAAAGAPVGKPDCAPNVLVIVVPGKAQLLGELEQHYAYLLANLTRRDVARLKASPDPTALWYMQAPVASDGRRLTPDPVAGTIVNRTTEATSRMRDFAHPSLTGGVLVIETRALAGLTPTQLADYAVMRALTGIDPARIPEGSPVSILKVLDAPMGGEVPITVTDWDVAFIRSLYASNPNTYAPSQRGQIASRMAKDLERRRDGDAPQ